MSVIKECSQTFIVHVNVQCTPGDLVKMQFQELCHDAGDSVFLTSFQMMERADDADGRTTLCIEDSILKCYTFIVNIIF